VEAGQSSPAGEAAWGADAGSRKGSESVILLFLNFHPHSIEEAASDLKNAFETGLLPNSFTDNKYFNIKVMNSIELK